MITREEFHAKCENIISDEDKIAINKTKRNNKITYAVVLPIEAIAGIILALTTTVFALIGVVVVMLISTLIISGAYSYKWDKYKNKYAAQIIDCLLENHAHTFTQSGHIDPMIFRSSCFYRPYDDFFGSDLLTIDIPKDDGNLSGIRLNICDIRTTKEETTTDSEGRTQTRTVTVYSGAFGYINFPFQFKCDLSLNSRLSGTSKIKLEDIKFNKTFDVYSNNQLEALVILTPTLMTKLLTLSNNVKGLRFALCQDGRLFISMNRNLFEVKVSKKSSINTLFDRFYDDINNILAIVEEIKNNNKVFKM